MASTELRIKLVWDAGPAIAQLETVLARMRELFPESTVVTLDLTDEPFVEPAYPTTWPDPGLTEREQT